MSHSIVPLHPMYDQAKRMEPQKLAQELQQAQGDVPCLAKTAPPLCYSPQQLRRAYGIQPLLDAGMTGKGRIITIIDAFQAPTIRQDLRMFDQLFGLPDPQLNIIAPFGLTPFDPNNPNHTGFAGEIALDVEWAHAMAPDATINLVLANVKDESVQGQLNALFQVLNFVVQNNMGSVISQSFGIGEGCLPAAMIQQAHKIYQQARAQKQTVFASAGDSGAGAIQCDANGQPAALVQGVNYPASDPLVTAVGGTTLRTAPSGAYIAETTWNESQRGSGATGGGTSKVFAQPAFQQNIVRSTKRAVSDIALDADPLTGVPIVTSSLRPGQTMILPTGGTSVGAPVAAAMTVLLDQAAGGKRLGFLNSAFYRLSQDTAAYRQSIHDIRTGNNTFVFAEGKQVIRVPGFQAQAGWDAPTGIGSPNATQLAKILPTLVNANEGADL
ncbi:MAG: S53 family peptidase [Ktedonobacteraceae bacterium]|nr:S53 family peptidase [Ktedonobacteraceae bacterium]